MVNRERMVGIARGLIGVESPTGECGAVADELARVLGEAGLEVARREAGHASAPAVVARWDSGRPGRVLQFNGHLDVVHLGYVAPRIEGGLLRGSGSADMKGGLAAAVEAMLAIAESGVVEGGGILLTAHDLHEAPWGDGSQLERLIDEGHIGDAVLIPEPLCDVLPVRGRGQACWKVTFRRAGGPVHEVMRDERAPDVVGAGALFVRRLKELDARLAEERDAVAGCSSVFVGRICSGEIFNQSPAECVLEGTRRWVPGVESSVVERGFRELIAGVEGETGASAEVGYRVVRGPYFLDEAGAIVEAFQEAHERVTGARLRTGAKWFVDDGNTFSSRAGVAAITHGPRAGGQHTTAEWVSIADMERVARVYVETARGFCGGV
jgi:acetylornithine deacetylase/succinyl-diaminopimelate desuccinylase-like protein